MLGRVLGVSHNVGSLMSYWILPSTGIPISRTTVQRVTNLESSTDSCKRRFEEYDKRIARRFNEQYISPRDSDYPDEKPDIEIWEKLAGGDESFYEEYDRTMDISSIP